MMMDDGNDSLNNTKVVWWTVDYHCDDDYSLLLNFQFSKRFSPSNGFEFRGPLAS
jgi:hypothetical protein